MRNVVKSKLKYEGKVFATKQDGDIEIVEYVNAKHVIIKFINTGYLTVGRVDNILIGQVKDRAKPSVYGVGVLGERLPLKEGARSKEYSVWMRMLDRCYSEKEDNDRVTYRGCTVSEDFKYFPYFKDWCKKQIGFGYKGFALDKDILVKGNKVYSEETCCFVPQEINNLFTNHKIIYTKSMCGVLPKNDKYVAALSKGGLRTHLGTFDTEYEAFQAYKTAKELYIKEVANRWKGKIDERVYEVLVNWEI